MTLDGQRRQEKICKKSTVETAEYSCSLEWEPHSFLIVRAVVRHNVGGGDCRTVHVDRRKLVTVGHGRMENAWIVSEAKTDFQ